MPMLPLSHPASRAKRIGQVENEEEPVRAQTPVGTELGVDMYVFIIF